MAYEDQLRRVVAPKAKITTDSFEVDFNDSDPIGYPVKLTLYRDPNGKFFYDYIDDGIKAGA